MRIECVNNASLVVEHADVSLVTNLWPQRFIFNNRWTHVPSTWFSHESFQSISHVRSSATSPAHFRPLDLNRLDSNARNGHPRP